MRLQTAVFLCVAIARREHGGNHQPQTALLKCQRLGIAQRNAALFASGEVAQAGAVAAVAAAFEHDGGVAFGNGAFIASLRLPCLHDAALQAFCTQRHVHAQQHCAKGQRKGVRRFHVPVACIAKTLLHARFKQRAAHIAIHSNAKQLHRLPVRCFNSGHHVCLFKLAHCSFLGSFCLPCA